MTFKKTGTVPLLGILDGYARLAPLYDQDETWLNSFEQKELWKMLGRVDGKSVLDAGCGTGRITRQLPPGGHVTGVDFSPEMLAIYRQRCPYATALLAPADEIPLPAENFDVIIASLLFVHLPDPLPPLQEFYRLLTPTGFILLTNIPQKREPVLSDGQHKFRIRSYHHSDREMEKLIKEADLKIVEKREVMEKGLAIATIYKLAK